MCRHLSYSHYASRNVCCRIHNTVTMTIAKLRIHKQISFVYRYGNYQRSTKKLRSGYGALWHIAIVNWLSVGRCISNLLLVIQTCFGNWLCFRLQVKIERTTMGPLNEIIIPNTVSVYVLQRKWNQFYKRCLGQHHKTVANVQYVGWPVRQFSAHRCHSTVIPRLMKILLPGFTFVSRNLR